VPRCSRQRLLSLLADIRRNTARPNPISLKHLKKASGKLHKCTCCWLHVGVASLIQDFKGRGYWTPTAADGQWASYLPFTELIKARFILFRVKGGLRSLTLCDDYTVKVETTFRMALKGGSTLFAREGDEFCISSLHFDGHKQYNRRLDQRRVLKNIGTTAGRVRLHRGIELNDDSSDHRNPDSQPYDDCQLLQLTDLLVSGFRAVLSEKMNAVTRQACLPLSELVQKWNRGRKGFSNSRWSNGFCISEGRIENGDWQFSPITDDTGVTQHGLY
jgi:hypothetical protein